MGDWLNWLRMVTTIAIIAAGCLFIGFVLKPFTEVVVILSVAWAWSVVHILHV
jgi:hypothetical protein